MIDIKLRQQVLKRDNYRCQNCDFTSSILIHHLIPKKKGGEDSLDNLVTLCKTCHPILEPRCDNNIGGSSARIDINVDDKFEKDFRDTVHRIYGFERGHMRAGMEAALRLWLEKNKVKTSE